MASLESDHMGSLHVEDSNFANGPADSLAEQGTSDLPPEQNSEKNEALNAESILEPIIGGEARTSEILSADGEPPAQEEAREAAIEGSAIVESVVNVEECAEKEVSSIEKLGEEQSFQSSIDTMKLWLDTDGMLLVTKPENFVREFEVFRRDPVLQGMSNVPKADHDTNLEAELLHLATQFQQSALWTKVVMSTIQKDGGCTGYDTLLTEMWAELDAGSVAQRACPEVDTRVQVIAAELKDHKDLAAKYGLRHDDEGLSSFGGRVENDLNKYYRLIKNVHNVTEKAKCSLAERTERKNRAETEQLKIESQIADAKDALSKAEAEVKSRVRKRDDTKTKVQQCIDTADSQEAEFGRVVKRRVEAREEALQKEEKQISGQRKIHKHNLTRLQISYHAELRIHGKAGESTPLLKHSSQMGTAMTESEEVITQPSLGSV